MMAIGNLPFRRRPETGVDFGRAGMKRPADGRAENR
jgi:hypothetical protein